MDSWRYTLPIAISAAAKANADLSCLQTDGSVRPYQACITGLHECEVTLKAEYRIEQDVVQLSAERPVRAQTLLSEIVAPHDHTYHEVCLVVSGRATHVTANERRSLTSADLFIIPPGVVHAIDEVDKLIHINVYYLSEWLMDDLELLGAEAGSIQLFLPHSLVRPKLLQATHFKLREDEFESIHSELIEIEEEGRRANISKLILRSCMLKTIATVARAWRREHEMESQLSIRHEVWDAISAIEKVVRGGEHFSIADTSAKLGLSADHFCAIFKKTIGYSPNDYFQRRRVHRSCQLLLNSRPTITEIAMDLGYSDAPHFCRMFKRYKDITPTEYRRIYRVAF